MSTQRQGQSGLGLAAQRFTIITYIQRRGQITAEFTDVESGKKNNRSKLLKAIAHCKQTGGVLLIAKLDRLTRNAAFIFTLRDSGVPFVCADMPQANTLTVRVMSTMAQYERKIISERTCRALVEKKRIGAKLGKPKNLTPQAVQKGLQVPQHDARLDENNRQAADLVHSLRQAGAE